MHVALSEKAHELVAELCHEANVEGVRADLVMLRAARAHAAWQESDQIREEDIRAVAELALYHRRKIAPSASPPSFTAGAGTMGQPDRKRASGNWGDLPPRPVATGPGREVSSLFEESAKIKKK